MVPYNAQYPDSQNVFNAVDDGTYDPADRPKVVKQYSNAVRWSVDKFFERLLQRPLPAGTLILYTSDHGQTLSANGRLQSHCSQGRLAIQEEANVPLFGITSDREWQALLSRGAAENHDRASTLDIFPTLLLAMGYDGNWIAQGFRDSLTSSLDRRRKRYFWAMTQPRPYDR
jgi:glucan phosphoethanolaminetransferase (alkaline phosphatase superfamily)